MPVANNRAVKFIKRRRSRRAPPFMRAIKNSNRFWHEPRFDIIGQLYVRKAMGAK